MKSKKLHFHPKYAIILLTCLFIVGFAYLGYSLQRPSKATILPPPPPQAEYVMLSKGNRSTATSMSLFRSDASQAKIVSGMTVPPGYLAIDNSDLETPLTSDGAHYVRFLYTGSTGNEQCYYQVINIDGSNGFISPGFGCRNSINMASSATRKGIFTQRNLISPDGSGILLSVYEPLGTTVSCKVYYITATQVVNIGDLSSNCNSPGQHIGDTHRYITDILRSSVVSKGGVFTIQYDQSSNLWTPRLLSASGTMLSLDLSGTGAPYTPSSSSRLSSHREVSTVFSRDDSRLFVTLSTQNKYSLFEFSNLGVQTRSYGSYSSPRRLLHQCRNLSYDEAYLICGNDNELTIRVSDGVSSVLTTPNSSARLIVQLSSLEQLAFVDRATKAVTVSNLDGTNAKTLTTPSGEDVDQIAWSDDGQKLAITRRETAGNRIGTVYVWQPNSSSVATSALVIQPINKFANLIWSYDNRYIAVTYQDFNNIRVSLLVNSYIVDTVLNTSVKLNLKLESTYAHGWAWKSNKLLVNDANVGGSLDGNKRFFLVNPDGTSTPIPGTYAANPQITGFGIKYNPNHRGWVLTDCTQPPVLNLTGPANNALVSGLVTVTVAPTTGICSTNRVTFSIDDVVKATSVAAPYSYTFDASALGIGTHSYKATVYDDGGLTDTITRQIQVVAKVGDLNGNGKVDIQDLALFISKYGQTVPSGTNGDFNGDGTVGIADLAILISKFGT